MNGQLELMPLSHKVTVYQITRPWGADKTVTSPPWWVWRCTCGRDVGAEHRAAYSREDAAVEMGQHHRHTWSPWDAS